MSYKIPLDDNLASIIVRDVNERLIASNIEQHEIAADALHAQERLTALLNEVDAIIHETVLPGGEVAFLSEKAGAFLGYPPENWNQRGFWRRVIHPDDRATAISPMVGTIRTGIASEQNFRVVKADGSLLWVCNRATVIPHAFDGTRTLRCVLTDITPRKTAEIAQAELLEREKRITEHLQRPLRADFAEDAFPNIRVAAWYEPAMDEAEVGGDFFDVFTVNDSDRPRRTVLCVGDVVGKGLSAAALAARLKELVNVFAFENPDPADILRRLNNYVCHLAALPANADSMMLAALAIAVVDCDAGVVTVASAGAEPLAVVRPDAPAEIIPNSGVTLGIAPGIEYENDTVTPSFGDMILLTTDGLTEARRGKEFLGYDGVLEIARANAAVDSIPNIGEAIMRDARAFAGQFGDDVCLVLMRCLKPPTAL